MRPVDRIAPIERRHFWFAARDGLVDVLLERFGAPDPVLDLGCGTGRFADRLAARGRSVVALDRDVEARAGAVAPRLAAEAEAVPAPGRSFGTVLARDVLEHGDDRALLGEAHRVLRPAGVLVVLVPAWPSLWSDRDERAGHLRRYTRAQLRMLLADAAFELVELRGYQLALLPVAAANRLVSRAVGRHRGAGVIDREEHPPRWLNTVFASVNGLEVRLAHRSAPRPPTGTSLVAVARRR